MKKSFYLFLLLCIIFYKCDASIPLTIESCISYDYSVKKLLTIHIDGYTDNYLFGKDGLVQLITTNSGCNFSNIPSGTSENLNAAAGDSTGIIIVGDSGIVLKGEFSPNLVLNVTSSGTQLNLYNVIKGFGNNVYIAAGAKGKILRSSDSGSGWDSVISGTTDNLYAIEKYAGVSENAIYISGFNGICVKSTDNGLTWSVLSRISGEASSLVYPTINSLFFADANTGWAAGNEGKIFRTTNGGNFWSSQSSGINQNINQIKFNSFNYGYAAGDSGRVIYTTNGGVNWYPHPSFDTLTSKNIRSFIQSDSTDFYIAGDSLMLSLSSEVSLKPLTGETYIGPTYEFTSMSEAVDAASYLGVKDSVTFIIEPGIYEKPFEINKIFPETAVIRFKALAPNTVTITKNLSDTTNYILKLNNAGNIKFENLIFSNPDTLKGRIVLLDGKLSDLEFRNVIFNGPALTVPSGNCNIIMNNLSSNSINNLSLNNCEFNNGAYGIRLLTSASFYSTGINIDNCSFSKNLYAAVNLNYSQDFTLNGNNFDSTVQCVVLNNCRNFEVTRNKMSAVYSGLSFSACNVTGQNRNLIANNFIQSIVIGLLFASTNNGNDMYHNSICIQHPYDTTIVSASVGLFSSFFSGSDNNFVNNLIINKRRGSALNFNYSGAFPFVSFDHNDYYTTGDTLALWKSIVYQDLNSLKAASGHDTNSVSENVYFNSAKDLHLTGSSNGNPLLAGIPVSSVPEDIDGFSRSQNLPYKGADEATIPLDFKKLFLKINFEALGITDTVNVQIRNALSPYNLIESKSGICGNGFTGQINYINAENGSPYFVAVKHRNSIETWSGIPQIFNGDTLNYDFTTGISQSYGDNMVNVSGQWSFYTGDVDQNGAVDLTDVIQIYNDAVNFLSGYIVTDLNGDNNADLTDVLSGYNNSAAFVAAVLP